MKVTSFLACAYGSYTSEGLIDLSGIGLDRFETPKLPLGVSIKLFARCESEFNDLPRKYKVNLHFFGDDKVLSKTPENTFETTEAKRNQHLIIDFGLKFEAEGDYRIDLLIDGQVMASWPIAVRLKT